ncbi:MAG: SIMPL domain-containing protein [Woeseiaceae bacterium]|nr:SIMPL domain-containing protein [Woeseiaceae bacterium]
MNTLNNWYATALLIACATGLSGVAAAHDGTQRSIAVTGHGEAAGPPDQATIHAGVQTLAPTVVESSQQNQAVVERIMRALDEQGIDEQDIQTSDYGIWPEQRHDPRGTGDVTITGYRVNNTVRVTIRDIDRVGKVLAAVTDAGANSIHGIHFGVKDAAELEARARAAAMADARARAAALAELAGVDLGEVLEISMAAGGGFPVPMGGGRMEMAQAAPVPGISAGQLNVAVQVQVTYAIR